MLITKKNVSCLRKKNKTEEWLGMRQDEEAKTTLHPRKCLCIYSLNTY